MRAFVAVLLVVLCVVRGQEEGAEESDGGGGEISNNYNEGFGGNFRTGTSGNIQMHHAKYGGPGFGGNFQTGTQQVLHANWGQGGKISYHQNRVQEFHGSHYWTRPIGRWERENPGKCPPWAKCRSTGTTGSNQPARVSNQVINDYVRANLNDPNKIGKGVSSNGYSGAIFSDF
jgi:hypothetical protein